MDAAVYERLLDTSRAVDVWLPDRRGADWPGLDHLRPEARTGRWQAITWLRGPSVLVLLTSGSPLTGRPTGTLGRRLRRRRQEVR